MADLSMRARFGARFVRGTGPAFGVSWQTWTILVQVWLIGSGWAGGGGSMSSVPVSRGSRARSSRCCRVAVAFGNAALRKLAFRRSTHGGPDAPGVAPGQLEWCPSWRTLRGHGWTSEPPGARSARPPDTPRPRALGAGPSSAPSPEQQRALAGRDAIRSIASTLRRRPDPGALLPAPGWAKPPMRRRSTGAGSRQPSRPA